jgi:hypothetical protein
MEALSQPVGYYCHCRLKKQRLIFFGGHLLFGMSYYRALVHRPRQVKAGEREDKV